MPHFTDGLMGAKCPAEVTQLAGELQTRRCRDPRRGDVCLIQAGHEGAVCPEVTLGHCPARHAGGRHTGPEMPGPGDP